MFKTNRLTARTSLCSAIVIIFLNLITTTLFATESDVTILHTNDWQSRLLGFGPNADFTPETINDDKTVGGISRLATLIAERRKVHGPDNVLLLDGGDYSMGTLFHTIIREAGTELQLMSTLQYDAITLGNHEFDYRPEGLASSIESALKAGAKLPPIVISNMVFDQQDPSDDKLQSLWQQGIIKPYVVITKGQKKVGIFGLMGSDAADVASNAYPTSFSNPIESAKQMVKILKEKEQVDLVVVLSHGGIKNDKNSPSKWYGEDVDLLNQVTGIDVVVGGHSHTPLETPISLDGRVVLQAGSEAQYLGELTVQIEQKKIVQSKYKLHKIDDTILGLSDINLQIEQFKQQVTEIFLQPAGYAFDQVLAQSHRHLSRDYNDNVIANLVTDSMLSATGADIAVSANGPIRDDIYLGSNGIQRVSDLFRIVPLGVGVSNDDSGYDLLKVWVTGREIKNLIEVQLLGYQLRGSSYYPRFSGFVVEYNSARLPFDQVTQIKLGNLKDGYQEIDLSSDNAQLYSMATNSFVGSFTWLVGELSYGMLEINAKYENGEMITDLSTAVFDSDPGQSGEQEVKEWNAFFAHIKNLPDLDADGLTDLPIKSENRLTKIHSFSPDKLYQNATKIMIAGSLVILLIVLLLGLLVRMIYRKFIPKY